MSSNFISNTISLDGVPQTKVKFPSDSKTIKLFYDYIDSSLKYINAQGQIYKLDQKLDGQLKLDESSNLIKKFVRSLNDNGIIPFDVESLAEATNKLIEELRTKINEIDTREELSKVVEELINLRGRSSEITSKLLNELDSRLSLFKFPDIKIEIVEEANVSSPYTTRQGNLYTIHISKQKNVQVGPGNNGGGISSAVVKKIINEELKGYEVPWYAVAGLGITVTPEGDDFNISVTDYISKSEVTSLTSSSSANSLAQANAYTNSRPTGISGSYVTTVNGLSGAVTIAVANFFSSDAVTLSGNLVTVSASMSANALAQANAFTSSRSGVTSVNGLSGAVTIPVANFFATNAVTLSGNLVTVSATMSANALAQANAYTNSRATGISGSYVTTVNGLSGAVTIPVANFFASDAVTLSGNLVTVSANMSANALAQANAFTNSRPTGISGSYVTTVNGVSGAVTIPVANFFSSDAVTLSGNLVTVSASMSANALVQANAYTDSRPTGIEGAYVTTVNGVSGAVTIPVANFFATNAVAMSANLRTRSAAMSANALVQANLYSDSKPVADFFATDAVTLSGNLVTVSANMSANALVHANSARISGNLLLTTLAATRSLTGTLTTIIASTSATLQLSTNNLATIVNGITEGVLLKTGGEMSGALILIDGTDGPNGSTRMISRGNVNFEKDLIFTGTKLYSWSDTALGLQSTHPWQSYLQFTNSAGTYIGKIGGFAPGIGGGILPGIGIYDVNNSAKFNYNVTLNSLKSFVPHIFGTEPVPTGTEQVRISGGLRVKDDAVFINRISIKQLHPEFLLDGISQYSESRILLTDSTNNIPNFGIWKISDEFFISGTAPGSSDYFSQKILRATVNSGQIRLGFYSATPVARQTAVADATDLATALTLINNLKTILRNIGIIT
jgi:hypothetical protein